MFKTNLENVLDLIDMPVWVVTEPRCKCNRGNYRINSKAINTLSVFPGVIQNVSVWRGYSPKDSNNTPIATVDVAVFPCGMEKSNTDAFFLNGERLNATVFTSKEEAEAEAKFLQCAKLTSVELLQHKADKNQTMFEKENANNG